MLDFNPCRACVPMPLRAFQPNRSAVLFSVAIAGLLLQGARPSTVAPPETVILRAPAVGVEVPLNVKEQKRVNEAVERGVAYLRSMQLVAGFFGNGRPSPEMGRLEPPWAVGYTALPALALLESGVPARDPAVEKAARFVRQNVPALTRTYEISLALLFLDRLGKAEDRPLIRSLALRLVAGQTYLGGWGYQCPVLTQVQEKKVLAALSKQKVKENPKPFPIPNPKGPNEKADNSNTQFAILALWTARKHDLPLNYTIAQVERRFRSGQHPDGWGYRLGYRRGDGLPYGSMTCVGLLGLAVGRGSAGEDSKPAREPSADKGIAVGLRALAHHMADPTDMRGTGDDTFLGPRKLNLYFLWSVERVGVLCNLKTIGGKDWYRWGADLLLRTQNADGSWNGRGNGGVAPVIDTSMALLFLKRSDLLPDLRETLQKRLKITDPGLDKAISPKKSPGEKGDFKKGIEKKSPGEKNDLKNGIEKKSPGEKNGASVEPRFDPLEQFELIEKKKIVEKKK